MVCVLQTWFSMRSYVMDLMSCSWERLDFSMLLKFSAIKKEEKYIVGLEEPSLRRGVALLPLPSEVVYVFYCVHFYIFLLT